MKLLSPKGVLILAASATGVGVAAARDPAFDMKNDMSPGRFESDATGGKLFTMNAVRAYEGKMIDFDTVENPPLPQLDGARICERWAVLTSIFEPTEAVHQLAELGDWCVVVVGDKKGEIWCVQGYTAFPTFENVSKATIWFRNRGERLLESVALGPFLAPRENPGKRRFSRIPLSIYRLATKRSPPSAFHK